MPDANKAQVISNLVGASVGAAGQRCMAISVALFVGAAREWIPEVAAELEKVKPGAWDDKDAAYGPLISPQAKQRVENFIRSEEHTSELQSRENLVCRLLLEKK